MAENNPIVSSGAFDFGDYVSGGNVFTTEGTTGDTDARSSISRTYVQNILRASDPIDEVPEGGGQPIKVTPPPEVSQALYEIDFNRKLFGANLDVVNTLQDIEFRQGFSGINTPVLNIAYLTLWKRGNAPTAGEKVSTEVVDANNTEFRIDKSTGTYGKLENSVFGQGAILDPQNVIFTGQGVQGTFESSPIYRFPEWTVRAPDAVENKTTSAIQTPSSQFLPPGAGADRGITLGSFESTIRLEDVLPPEFSLSDGFFQPLSVLNDLFQINSKPEIKPNRLLALSKAKIRLEEEKAKESPSTEMVRYYEDTIKQLEASTDEQFVADNDLPPDPRLEKAQPLPPLDGEVRKADVSWTTPPGSLLNKTGTPTEKVEGIWQFLFNPQTLERSFGPEYQFASTWGVPDGQPAHYSGHKNQELRFRDIILNGFVFGKRVESLVKGLEELTHVEKDSGQQSPPVLEFVWGKKVFGPCIMEDISITEQKWDGGELVDATLSFTLKKIPEWVVNDEYINIFNPVGQPLQQIIIEQPETTETTTGDGTTGDGTTGDGELSAEQKEANKLSPQCIDFNAYANLMQNLYSGVIPGIYSTLDKNGVDASPSPLNNSNREKLINFVDHATKSRIDLKYANNNILKKIKPELDSAIDEKNIRNLIEKLSKDKKASGQGNSTRLRTQEEWRAEMQNILNIMNNFMKVLETASKNYGPCGFKANLRVPGGKKVKPEVSQNEVERQKREVCGNLPSIVGKANTGKKEEDRLRGLYDDLTTMANKLIGYDSNLSGKAISIKNRIVQLGSVTFYLGNKTTMNCRGFVNNNSEAPPGSNTFEKGQAFANCYKDGGLSDDTYLKIYNSLFSLSDCRNQGGITSSTPNPSTTIRKRGRTGQGRTSQ